MAKTTGEQRQIIVRLAISKEEFLKLYRGVASEVTARSVDGLNIRFPASALRPHVTREGIFGTFRLTIDANNKLLELVKIIEAG